MLHYATALRSPNLPQRRAAARELAQMGAAMPSAAIAYLVPLLGDADELVREHAAEALGRAGAAYPEAHDSVVAALEEMLASPHTPTRMRGAMVAGRLGPAVSELAPALAGILRDTNLILCRIAADALTRLGASVVPVLEGLQDDADRHVRRQVQWALQKLASELAGKAPTQLRVETRVEMANRPTERVPVMAMPASLQRTQVVPIAPLVPSERRRQPRFRCGRDTSYRFSTDPFSDPWAKAEIRDISASGIGIVCTRHAPAGTCMTIDLQQADPAVGRHALARVKHCQAAAAGWHLGCAFLASLVPADLHRLRENPAASPNLTPR